MTPTARDSLFKCLLALLALTVLLPVVFSRHGVLTRWRSNLPPPGAPSLSLLSSPTDPRVYRHATLTNGLPVVVVSDASSSKASAALQVGVGSWGDPPEYQGLAHFLEHCLFLGSAGFPGENEYGAFLAEHGGASNAFTSQDATQYYFSIDAAHLPRALSIFGGFFTAPLIPSASMGREVRAVNAEHAKNLQSNGWRAWQLLKHAATAASPLHAFSTGNSSTLDVPGVRAALLAFACRHYYAENMQVAVVGPHGVEELLQLAEGVFGGVRRGPAEAEAEYVGAGQGGAAAPWAGETLHGVRTASQQVAAAAQGLDSAAHPLLSPLGAFPLPARGSLRVYAPIGSTHELTLVWPVAGERSAFGGRVGAAAYICAALNDKGPAGLLAGLKRRGWVEGLAAGLDLATQPLALLSLTLELSPGLIEHLESRTVSSGKEAGASMLQAHVGAILGAVGVFLDALEVAVGEDAAAAWGSIVANAEKSELQGVAARGRLESVYGLSEEEGRELSGGVPPSLLPRNSSTQWSAMAERAARLGSRGVSRHYYSVRDDKGGVGGELLSWPLTPSAAQRLWREEGQYAQAQWLYPASVPNAEARVQALVAAMAEGAGPRDVLAPPSQRVWQPVAVLRLLRQLVPAGVVGLLATPLAGRLLSLEQLEPIYGVWFTQLSVQQALQLAPEAGLPAAAAGLPEPNAFIPSAWELVSHRAYAAALGIKETAGRAEGCVSTVQLLPLEARTPVPIALHFAPSSCVPEPRLVWGVELLPLPGALQGSAQAAVLTSLWLAAVEESTREAMEPAARAGASAALSVSAGSGALALTGQCFTGSSGCREFFAAALAGYLRLPGCSLTARLQVLLMEWRSALLQTQPYLQAFEEAALVSGERRYSQQVLLQAAEGLVEGGEEGLQAALAQHHQQVFAGLQAVQVLLSGNVDLQGALQLVREAVLPVLPRNAERVYSAEAAAAAAGIAASRSARVLKGAAGGTLLTVPGRNPADSNGAALALVDGGAGRTPTLLVLGALAREPAFDELRTKQALGYIASAGVRWVSGAEGTGGRNVSLRVVRMSPTSSGLATSVELIQLPQAMAQRGSLYVLVQGVALSAQGMGERVGGFLAGLGGVLRGLGGQAVASVAGAMAREARQGKQSVREEWERQWEGVAGHGLWDVGGEGEAQGLLEVTAEGVGGAWEGMERQGVASVLVVGGGRKE